jgi:hypothetical protein
VHPEVLRFCAAEWLGDDHFHAVQEHAVQEAVESVIDRLRAMAGSIDDGADLVNPVLGGDTRHSPSIHAPRRAFSAPASARGPTAPGGSA